jgi:hypothetical protein
MTTSPAEITFLVYDGGTLAVDGVDESPPRGECWALYLSDKPTADEIVAIVEENWDAKQVVGQVCLDARDEGDGDPDLDIEELTEWLAASPKNVQIAAAELRQWLDDTNLTDEDYDQAASTGLTPQGAALIFWRDGDLDPEDFGIEIVEGEFPGSSYFAAELQESIEYANEVAQRLGAAVEFVEAE